MLAGIFAVFFLSLGNVVALSTPARAAATGSEPVVIDVGAESVGAVTLELGVTHTQHTLDFGAPEALARAREVLRNAAKYQNQPIMGWGTENPEPYPGVFSWKSLDRRVAMIRANSGIAVLTLCIAPDWMKGGKSGDTNWDMVDVAPLPEHFYDFAELAEKIALRYPDVKYYQIWCELKGFWKHRENRWDIELYTQFYNLIYDRLKAVNPDVKIGGPYVFVGIRETEGVFSSTTLRGAYGAIDQRSLDAISYWLDHKHGADFITVDGASYDKANTASTNTPRNLLERLQFYADVASWIKAHTDLPLWWAEWYSADGSLPVDMQNVLMTATVMRMISTARVALRWRPQGEQGVGFGGSVESLWSDPIETAGGAPFPIGETLAMFRRDFPPGTILYPLYSSNNLVSGIASANTILLTNMDAMPHYLLVEGAQSYLQPYTSAFLNRQPPNHYKFPQ